MLAIAGGMTIAAFMVAIMFKRISASAALVLFPIIAAVLLGRGADVGGMALAGVIQVAPIVAVLVFAIVYFGLMIDAGLFDPLVQVVIKNASGDPMKVAVGTAIVAILVSLDGDGATTALVTISAFLPVYRRLGMNPLILGLLLGLSNTIVNIAPWGGPAGRVSAALKVDPGEIFVPLIPPMLMGMVATVVIAVMLGRKERARLGISSIAVKAEQLFPDRALSAPRPRLLHVNAALTLAVMTASALHLLPLAVLFIVAVAVAATINYPSLSDQRERLAGHATNALPLALLVFSAGIFVGVMDGTGMLGAMADVVVAVVPPSIGEWFGPITAVLSGLFTFILSNDAYYFGIVPVIARSAQEYGIEPVVIARASLLGQPIHGLSPLVPALYLAASLLKVEVGAMMRFSIGWAILVTFAMIIMAWLTGAIV